MPFPNYPCPSNTAHPSSPTQMSHTPSVNNFLAHQIAVGLCPPHHHTLLWHFLYLTEIVRVWGFCPLCKYPAPSLGSWVTVEHFPDEQGCGIKYCEAFSTCRTLSIPSPFTSSPGQPCRDSPCPPSAPSLSPHSKPGRGCIRSPKPWEGFLCRQAQTHTVPGRRGSPNEQILFSSNTLLRSPTTLSPKSR